MCPQDLGQLCAGARAGARIARRPRPGAHLRGHHRSAGRLPRLRKAYPRTEPASGGHASDGTLHAHKPERTAQCLRVPGTGTPPRQPGCGADMPCRCSRQWAPACAGRRRTAGSAGCRQRNSGHA
ncbi:hypothetical protein XAP6164_3290004 [Xanthomonas phaseoli pv. phaseoli]|nr:hypothetical protein XAP6164_3290004 [Xanthomonas phaseoli pv. phaseoli]